jgi:ATP-dependent helicase/nuclease subunit A
MNHAPATAGSKAQRGAFIGLAIDDRAFAHRAILASAGSGKTHALTNRYLQLVAAGAAPSTILATTFTRLAAAEIRDRVLQRLSDAALHAKERKALAESLQLAEAKQLTEASATALLAHLVRKLHVLQLRTLDSFFAAVVRASCIELGLPIGADVIDEEQATALRREAIALMLDERQPQELVELLRQLTRGDAGRSVTEAIDSVVKDLYDLWSEAPAEAWDCVPQLAGKLKLLEVMAAIEALEFASPGTDQRFIKAHAADTQRARALDWEEFVKCGIAARIAGDERTYYSKALPADLVAAYVPLVEHAKAEVVAKLRHQTLATREMLRLFHAQFDHLKRVRGVVTFGDLVLWCQRAIERDSLETIAFRLDSQVRHLLLDEFQDTSIAQWRALQPIVEEITATAPPDRSVFCVGDVKQSIYGWRGAAPEVLQELPGAFGLDVKMLAKSYRSSSVVIDVVNKVFEGLLTNLALRDHVDTAQAWLDGFVHHESARPERAGYVDLRVVQRIDSNSEKGDKRQWAFRLRKAAENAATLAQQHPDITIAILVRKNASVARLLVELGPSRLNVRASGRGGGPVTDAPAVNALLDLLRLVDHPDDTVAAFNVATSPVGECVGLREWSSGTSREAVAARVRSDVLADGVAMTLAKLARRIAGDCDAREIRRVYQLVELAGQFDEQPSLRMDDFVALAEQKALAATQPARVQVMTIHQAKGLDFDAVILPDLDCRLTGHTPPKVLYERDGETGPITRMCRYFSKDVQPFVPELQPLKARYVHRTVRESLSLLYVAMTRAKHAVHIFVDEPKANERTMSCTAGNVVRCALAPGSLTANEIAFSHGNAKWMETLEKPAEAARLSPIAEETSVRLAPSRRRTFERASSPAELTGRLVVAAPGGWQMRLDSEARDRGTAIHRLIQQVEWLDEFQLDVAAQAAVVCAHLPRRTTDWHAQHVSEFRRVMAHPEVAAVLSRPKSSGRLIVRREIPFARLTSEGLQTGAIDRLVIEERDGAFVRAEVVDFKTNVLEADSVEQEALRYQPQLQAYRDAAAELLGIEPGLIAMKIVFLHVGRVVAL